MHPAKQAIRGLSACAAWAGHHKREAEKLDGQLCFTSSLFFPSQTFFLVFLLSLNDIVGGVRMLQVFSYLSSEVDWCEANFERSEYIAEYYNSVTPPDNVGESLCIRVDAPFPPLLPIHWGVCVELGCWVGAP